MSRAAGSSLPRDGSGVVPGSPAGRVRSDRIRSVRWLATFARTTSLAKASARAGSAKTRYWSARKLVFLAGAGINAATNRPYGVI